MAEIKKFIVGSEKFPVWFNEEAAKGRLKLNYDEEGILQTITVYSPLKTTLAKKGDVIMLLKSGLQVISSKDAVKYGVKNEKTE